MDDPQRGTVVEGIHEEHLSSARQLSELMAQAEPRRTVRTSLVWQDGTLQRRSSSSRHSGPCKAAEFDAPRAAKPLTFITDGDRVPALRVSESHTGPCSL